jgi:protease-4
MAQKKETNYLYLLLGGMAVVAALLIFAYPLLPIEGCVGVVEIQGPIITNDVSPSLLSDGMKGSETIAAEIESADKRADVKSVLVLIDSPGGSVVASRQIYDALSSLNKSSVSYINEVGASGGYYVAAGTDYIISNPDALTGSIGARATFYDFTGLFDKLGMNETTIKTGEMKDIGSQARPMTPQEREVLQVIINESFYEFRSAVEKSRGGHLDRAGFEKVLDARVLSGRQAKKIGLVDELGNKKAAIMKAAKEGGIKSEDPPLCYLASTKGRGGLLGSFSADVDKLLAASGNVPRLSYQ